jgi:hypothetical protein
MMAITTKSSTSEKARRGGWDFMVLIPREESGAIPTCMFQSRPAPVKVNPGELPYNNIMSTPAPKKNRRWIWFFVVVFALAFLATAVLVAVNLGLQLKPEQLAAARELWRKQGPRDYTMSYTTRVHAEPEDNVSHYWVKVRGGRVVESKFNEQAESASQFPYRGMEGLFDDIERFMKIDSEPGRPKVYVRAVFDERTGGLHSYVHRVMGSPQRVQIIVDGFTADSP